MQILYNITEVLPAYCSAERKGDIERSHVLLSEPRDCAPVGYQLAVPKRLCCQFRDTLHYVWSRGETGLGTREDEYVSFYGT